MASKNIVDKFVQAYKNGEVGNSPDLSSNDNGSPSQPPQKKSSKNDIVSKFVSAYKNGQVGNQPDTQLQQPSQQSTPAPQAQPSNAGPADNSVPGTMGNFFKAGIGSGFVGLPGMAIQGAYGATQGNGALNSASQALNYALAPEHSAYAALNPELDLSHPTGMQQVANIAGQIVGGIPHVFLAGEGIPEELGILGRAAALGGKAIKSAFKAAPTVGAGAAVGASTGAIGSAIGERALPDDMSPQDRADALNIISTLSGAAGGLGAGALGNKFGTMLNGKVAAAKQTAGVLGTPEAQETLAGGPDTPVANAQPSLANTQDLPLNTYLRNSLDKMVGNANQMSDARYNAVEKRIGDNLISIDNNAVEKNQSLGNVTQKNIDNGLDDVITEFPTFKEGINYLRSNFFAPLLAAKEHGKDAQLSFENIQGAFRTLNDLRNTLNITKLTGPVKQQLNGYRTILKDAINNHLEEGEANQPKLATGEDNPNYNPNIPTYAPGTGQLYNQADYLYGRLRKAQTVSKTLNYKNIDDDVQNDTLEQNTLDDVLTGKPQGHLENVTRAMQDINNGSPNDTSLVDQNVNGLNNLQDKANKAAAIRGNQALWDLNTGFIKQRNTFTNPENEEYNTKSNLIISPNSFNNAVQDKVANLFKQGNLAKGTDSIGGMTNAINEMADMHDKLARNQNEHGNQPLDPNTLHTLKTAKMFKQVLDLGANNPQFLTQLKQGIGQFNPNSPDAATTAARVLYNLSSVANNVTQRQNALGYQPVSNPSDAATKMVINTIIPSKLWKIFSKITHIPDSGAMQNQALENITNKITNPTGRAELQQDYANANSTLNKKKWMSKVMGANSAQAGAIAGNKPDMVPANISGPIGQQ